MTSSNKMESISYFKKGVFQPPKEYEEDVKHLRDWLKGQPHLPDISDEHLYLFLHSCIHNLTLTKATIEHYYTLRTHSPELFDDRDPMSTDCQNVFNMSEFIPLTRTTPEGYNVVLYKLSDPDPAKLNFVSSLKAFFIFNDIRLAEDGLSPGYVVIFDMKGVNLGHLTKVNLSAVKKFMTYIQECHPIRLKRVHVINTVAFMDKVLALVKPFMKSSLMSILHLHGPVESLEKFLPLEILPEEYGGKSESCSVIFGRERARMEKEYIAWLQQESSLKVDESKRQGKKNTETDSYGVEGSFRRLAID
ncbi:hypothetical protein C0J52_14955 [Blattella germanica]|nr:hypothetical protein C0J52_14955 [Blattella germanica]